MTELELAQVAALAACRFSPGSTEKRFVRDMAARAADYELSAKQAAFLDTLAHRYRKQIGRCLSASCAVCRSKLDLPKLKYYSGGNGKRHGSTSRQVLPPTYTQAVAVLEEAESNGADSVWWNHASDSRPTLNYFAICRCECGEVVLRDDVCPTCRLLASLHRDPHQRGAQVQFERAERAQNRLADLVVDLQRKARGAA